jgi:hypothetical protein
MRLRSRPLGTRPRADHSEPTDPGNRSAGHVRPPDPPRSRGGCERRPVQDGDHGPQRGERDAISASSSPRRPSGSTPPGGAGRSTATTPMAGSTTAAEASPAAAGPPPTHPPDAWPATPGVGRHVEQPDHAPDLDLAGVEQVASPTAPPAATRCRSPVSATGQWPRWPSSPDAGSRSTASPHRPRPSTWPVCLP